MHRSTHRACALGCNGVRTADSCRMQFGRTPGPSQAVAGAFLTLGKPIDLHPRLAHAAPGGTRGRILGALGHKRGKSQRITYNVIPERVGGSTSRPGSVQPALLAEFNDRSAGDDRVSRQSWSPAPMNVIAAAVPSTAF
jgi:hypothetical protein